MAKKPPADAPADAPAYILQFPPRYERLACPPPYDAEAVTMRVNVTAAELEAHRADSVADTLASYVQEWTFRLADGTPAPVCAGVILACPPDLQTWLWQEWLERRASPLGKRSPLTALPATSTPPASTGTGRTSG